MFSPIKSLITYIQKNASGSNFFGGTSSNTKLSDDDDPTMESELVNTNFDTNQPALTELEPVNDKNHDQNENLVFEDCTAVTESTAADDPLMINGDEEEEKDVFLDFPIATQNEESDVEFAANEVVVLDNPDLNNSVASDPGIDPLAIDDFPNHADVVSPLRLDSSVDGDVLFMGPVDDIEVKSEQITDEGVSENARIMAAVKAADEQEIRSDGSDSGLGSETSALQSTVTSIADTSACSTASCSTPIVKKIPLRSNLKRRLQEVVDGEDQIQKKARKSINFDGVKVFYFPRIQGHGCVPSQGGCTLGMGAHHISFKTFSLAEHAAELRRAHKLQLQEINPRGSSSEESDSDEELSEGSGSDLDADTNGFLQPVSPKQRRALLKAAGVRKIDPSEKIECRDIRNSREVCGCVCRDFCDPDTCACSQAGIKCQVDRAMFPCGCSRDACGNAIGRIEFNPARVRTHFIHTIMRLDMENRQQKRPDELVASTSHLMYSGVPAIANGPTAINNYNTIPSYGLEQASSAVPHAYHHHMHPQHNVYMNHIPPAHPVGSIYGAPMGIEAPTTSLPLQQTHSHYVTTAGVEPDGIAGSLHYQDGPLYPPVHAAALAPPVTAVYGDILAPYATSTPYHSVHAVDNSYPNVYTSYHNPHHHQNHSMAHQQPLLGFAPACSGDLNEYNDSQSSFISLNTPEASSSRLSAINDLLHNNRNTTAALVAVSPVTPEPVDAIPGVSCVILQVQELPNSSSVREVVEEEVQREEQEKEETLAESSAEEEKEKEKQTDANTSPQLPPDENPQLEPSELTNITIETTETTTKKDEENDLGPSDPPPPESSEDVPTPITEESETESITRPTEPVVVEANPPVNPATESEDERITDDILPPPPPIVETVSA